MGSRLTLNVWQRAALLVPAAVIAIVVVGQATDEPVEGFAWVAALSLAGGLAYVALAGVGASAAQTGMTLWQRVALGSTAVLIAGLQLLSFADQGVRDMEWAIALAAAGAFGFAALSQLSASPRTDSLQRDQPTGERASEASRHSGDEAATARHSFSITDVERFAGTCRALAAELVPKLRPTGGPRLTVNSPKGPVDPLEAYVEEVSLAYSYGICSFVACIHNQQWHKTKICSDATQRIVADLTAIQTRNPVGGLDEATAKKASEDSTAEHLKSASMAAFMFAKEASEEGHETLRAFGQAVRTGKIPQLSERRAPSGPEALSNWLDEPGSGENHLVYLQRLLAKSMGAEFRGENFAARLEELYGALTREMIRRAAAGLQAPLLSNVAAVGQRTDAAPDSPTKSEVEAVVLRHRKLLADAGSSGDPKDFAVNMDYCPPNAAGALNKGLWVCGCCWSPFTVDPEQVGLWFSVDHKGAPVALCAVCLEYLNQIHSREKGKPLLSLPAAYDAMGQQFAQKFPGEPPVKVAVMRAALIDRRAKASR